MPHVTVLHNPRCSKSRQTLALLSAHGIAHDVIEYLKTPLSAEELKQVFAKLNVSQVTQMMRTKEEAYKEQQLDDNSVSDDMRFNAMAATPKLMERPIVIAGEQARIGRPPESVLELFK